MKVVLTRDLGEPFIAICLPLCLCKDKLTIVPQREIRYMSCLRNVSNVRIY